jgi:hypothetical protein
VITNPVVITILAFAIPIVPGVLVILGGRPPAKRDKDGAP